MSTGLPSPPRTPFASPATAPAARRERARAARGPRGSAIHWAPSPTFTRAEIALAALASVLLAVLTSWPLVLHMPSRIAPDLGDPVRTAWEVAWVGHAMLHDPLSIFNSNAFYPRPLSLAFSDSLLGYGPAAFFGSGTVAALVRYNLLFLWAWSFCFFGAYMLARELGLARLGAAAAGLAFAYAPYRVTEAGHLHVISSGGLAMGLFLLLRGYRRGSRKLVLAGWLLSAWQISLGFTLGLQYAYMLAVLALIVLFYWWRGRLTPGAAWLPAGERAGAQPQPRPGGRIVAREHPAQAAAPPGAHRRSRARRGPLIPRQLLAVTLIGVAVLGAVTVYQARPYLRVAALYPTAKRTLKEVETYSAGPAAFLAASSENRVYGSLTSGMRAKVNSKNESVFFPGGLILVLALLGLGAGVYTKRLRIGLVAGIVVCSILALGLSLTGAGYPYRLLYDYAPGWDGVRVPGRIFTLATLCYALLAGAGAQLLVKRLSTWASSRRSGERPRVGEQPLADARAKRAPRRLGLALPAIGLPALVGAVLLVGILGEGAGHLGHPLVPQPARAEIGLPGPILDLPTDGALDRIWQYFSTDGFPKIANGESTFDIPAEDDLRGGMAGFPDRASVEKLRYYGIKTVVLHTVLPKDLPPEEGQVVPEPDDPAANARKPIAGLGITRRQVGSVVIYEIGPGPKALHGTDG
ncbi:MAG TPA: hypothetical protein VMD79_02435 [Solirubrobacteraceae bacterium]|nr:hypothetical protein [Solirubrobacteraceae bacterium]